MEDFWHPEVKSSEGTPLQLDVYIPSLSLAFEYQGIQHYQDFYAFGGASVRLYEIRDQEKRELCKKLNITLIEIPYPC